MKPQIPWLRVFVEGVVIVGSILLAFGLQAWWEGRQEREEELALLVAMQGDLVASRDLVEVSISFVEAAMGRLRNFALGSSTGANELLPDSTNNAILSALTRPWTTELALGSIDAAISSGNLGLIRDPNVRAALVNATKRDADLAETRQLLTQITKDATHAVNRHPEIARSLSMSNEDRAANSVSLDRLRSDVEVMAFVADKIVALNGYVIQSRTLLTHLNSTIRLVEPASEGGV